MGLVVHLGHGGRPCPPHSSMQNLKRKARCLDEEMDDDDDPEWFDVVEGGEKDVKKKKIEPGVLVIVDKGGLYKQRVHWCSCQNPLDRHIQLLQMGFYPGSIKRPRTAFTFNLLDYYHMDAMECRTSALNFFNKLCRLTNDSFPNLVYVSALFPDNADF